MRAGLSRSPWSRDLETNHHDRGHWAIVCDSRDTFQLSPAWIPALKLSTKFHNILRRMYWDAMLNGRPVSPPAIGMFVCQVNHQRVGGFKNNLLVIYFAGKHGLTMFKILP